MQFGIETLLSNPKLLKQLHGRRVALCAHPASINSKLEHSLDLLANQKKINLTSAFGPQHGLRGEKQDNMIESDDYKDPHYNIPVYSLYGKVRRPTSEMMESFDVLLYDLQDVGTRVYTFLTTLFYLIEACAEHNKTLWVLDRPNPAGRAVEGSLLKKGWESFVGGAEVPMRHGMTMGEIALWYQKTINLNVDIEVIPLKGYRPNKAYTYGWPVGKLPWVNPSPNIPNVFTTHVYPGSVILEGTNLSEGRGTTTPLSVIGAKHFDTIEIFRKLEKMEKKWLRGCHLRQCYFEPTFHKFSGELCEGFQIHVDDQTLKQEQFKPYRLIALILKAFRQTHPDFDLWSDRPYEYVEDKKPIDVITGGLYFKNWVDDHQAKPKDLDIFLSEDEKLWKNSIKPFLMYS